MNILFLKPIEINSLLVVLALVGALAIIFAVLIVLISKLCHVHQDDRLEKIQQNLSGANCGGCGFAGCADFARALLEGRADLKQCGPTSNKSKLEISKILGTTFVEQEQAFAVVHCIGGNKSLNKYIYIGNDGCIAQSKLLGGIKVCPEGCLGGGTCEKVCPTGAIKVIDGVAYTNKALCNTCSVCINSCPKQIVSLIPKTAKVYIACSTKCRGKQVLSTCKVGCIGCGVCDKNCPSGAITMVDNMPVIDYSKCSR